jgi:hypothetical protein
VSEPLAYMQLAQQYLERACAGHPMLFGAVGLPIVQVQYGHTLEVHLNNVKAGVDKLREMANGLSYTAAHWANAEWANTPVGKPPHLEYKTPSAGSGLKNAAEFGGLYWVASLAAARLAAEESMARSVRADQVVAAAQVECRAGGSAQGWRRAPYSVRELAHRAGRG